MSKDYEVYNVLEQLSVPYTIHEHPPVFTVAEAEKYWGDIQGAHCKNLFLRNKKGKNHYLVILEHSKRMDLKSLERRLNEDRLSFASEDRLERYLGLSSGAVSPFGLINDHDKNVRVILDEDLRKEELINFHPNVNTSTITIAFEDFMTFLVWCKTEVHTMKFF